MSSRAQVRQGKVDTYCSENLTLPDVLLLLNKGSDDGPRDLSRRVIPGLCIRVIDDKAQ